MANFYSYVFYRIYKFFKSSRNEDIAEWKATILLSLLITCNMFVGLISVINFKLYLSQALFQCVLVLLFALVYFVNYIIFIKDEKFKRIEKAFKSESTSRKRIGSVSILLYVVVSVISVFFIGMYEK